MPATREQRLRLRDALVSAFPTGSSFAQMVYFALGEHADAITPSASPLVDRAAQLIIWCDARGRLDELVQHARAQNPTNPELAEVFNTWPFGVTAAPHPLGDPAGRANSRTPWVVAGVLASIIMFTFVSMKFITSPWGIVSTKDASADGRVDAAADESPGWDGSTDAGADARTDALTEEVPPPEHSCPQNMVLIRGGAFVMGSPPNEGRPDEWPQHRVTVGTFCIDRTEASVTEYQACVMARACPEPKAYGPVSRTTHPFCNWHRPGFEEHPVNCLDWRWARAYCEWRRRRLLRESEWEFAARGTAGRTYPWGEPAPDGTRVNFCGDECQVYVRTLGTSDAERFRGLAGWHDSAPGTAPVDSFDAGATPEGVLHLAGNVSEWIEDEYLPDAYERHIPDGRLPARLPGTEGRLRVKRGGGWDQTDPSFLRATYRDRGGLGDLDANGGVRCARDPD